MHNKLASKLLRKASSALTKSAHLLSQASNSAYPYKSINDLDKKIAKLLPEILRPNTFYIEAGANDGIKQSNTFFLESIYGAEGLLIEPSPSNFEKCVSNRSSTNIFELKALVDQENDGKPLRLIYSDLMTTGTNSEDVDPIQHAKSGLKFFDGINYEFLAETTTLAKLLDKYSIKQVDFLSLDLEGAELEALRGAELERQMIMNILVETRNIKDIHSYLKEKGYKMIERLSRHDYLFSKERD